MGGGWCLILVFLHGDTVRDQGKQGFVSKGVTLLWLKVDSLTVFFGPGDSRGGSGPTVCSSWTEGTNSGAPLRLPSKVGNSGSKERTRGH